MIIINFTPGTSYRQKGRGRKQNKSSNNRNYEENKKEIPKEIKLTGEEIKYPESGAMILAQMVTENLKKRMLSAEQ